MTVKQEYKVIFKNNSHSCLKSLFHSGNKAVVSCITGPQHTSDKSQAKISFLKHVLHT
jgi:maltose-binding protein MalE